MSGTAEPINQPVNDAEWARDTNRRLESLENPTSQRVGKWVISTSDEGHLIVSHVAGGSVVLAQQPTTGEDDPDAITTDTPAAVIVTRTADQTVTNAGAWVEFDGVAAQAGGDWTGGKAKLDAVIVPVTGLYNVSATVWFSAGGAMLMALVYVDGETRLASRVLETGGNVVINSTISGMLSLTAGQTVGLWAQPSASRLVGAGGFDNPIPTSLSLSLASRKE
jgi:hypothetical protein